MEKEEEQEKREKEQKLVGEQRSKELDGEHQKWERGLTRRRDKERQRMVGAMDNETRGSKGAKRVVGGGGITEGGRKNKRARKYSLLGENWGAPQGDVRVRQKGEGAIEGSRGAEPREEGGREDEQMLLVPPAPHREQAEVGVTTPSEKVKARGAVTQKNLALIMTKSQSDYVEKGQLDQTMGDGGNKTDNCGNSGEMGVVRTNIESMGGDMSHGDEPQCEFRRGVCLTHKLKGNKKTLSIKKWKKKKYGYGWVTVKETQYSCSYRAGNTTEYQDIMNSEGNCRSPARNIGDISGCSGSVLGINREGLFSDCDAGLERESVKNED